MNSKDEHSFLSYQFSELRIRSWNGYSQSAISLTDYQILVPQAINYKVGF